VTADPNRAPAPVVKNKTGIQITVLKTAFYRFSNHRFEITIFFAKTPSF
jgi:hypothetical protein